MILVDTGPFVALFDPRDPDHASPGSSALRQFIRRGGCALHAVDEGQLARCFELMDRYADRPMDLADASLVTAAETLRLTTVFTFDRDDFTTYRARIGKTYKRFRIVPTAE